MKENLNNALLMRMQIGTVTTENSLEVPQKIKNETALGPTSRYISKETHNTSWKVHMHPFVCYSVGYNSQAMETIQVTINTGLNEKKAVVHVYSGVLLSH